jgi:hypothetical protein
MAAKVNLNRLDDFALALAAGQTVLDFCRSRGVSPSTCYAWKGLEGFGARVEAYRSQLRAQTLSLLAAKAAGLGPSVPSPSVPANPPPTAA